MIYDQFTNFKHARYAHRLSLKNLSTYIYSCSCAVACLLYIPNSFTANELRYVIYKEKYLYDNYTCIFFCTPLVEDCLIGGKRAQMTISIPAIFITVDCMCAFLRAAVIT